MADLEDDTLPYPVLVGIIDNVDDLHTLYALLTVSQQAFEITARLLYRNPFHSAALAINKRHKVYGRLFEFLVEHLTFSHKQEEEDFDEDRKDDDLLRALGYYRRQAGVSHQQQQAQQSCSQLNHLTTPPLRRDYLSFVESMDGLVEFMASPALAISMHWVEKATRLPWSASLVNAVTSSLAWALGQYRPLKQQQRQWRMLRGVVISLYNDRTQLFASKMDEMVAVEHLVLDMGRQENHFFRPVRPEMMQGAMRFIEQWMSRNSDFPILKNVVFSNMTSQELADAQIQTWERAVYERAMPCANHRFLKVHQGNWAQFLRLATSDADYEAVRSIDLLSDKHSPTPPHLFFSSGDGQSERPPEPPLESILQRCRFLHSLSIPCSTVDTFNWGAFSAAGDSPGTHSFSSCIPLQHLNVEGDAGHMQSIIQYALQAFSETLRTARFKPLPATMNPYTGRDIDDPHYCHSPDITIGSGWRLPNLTMLQISLQGVLHLDSAAFQHCPCLVSLEIEDDTPKYSPPSPSSKAATPSAPISSWHLPSLQHLVLKGYPAVIFSPAFLRAIGPTLTYLELQGAGWLGDERRFYIPPSSDERRAKIESWRQHGHWRLPNVKEMRLVGECALWFDMDAVFSREYCPQLKVLTLDIGGHRFSSPVATNSGDKQQLNNEEQENNSSSSHCQPLSLLESLYLIGSWEVTDTSLEAILHRLCPRLKLLVLQQTRTYTNPGLVAMAERHATLERVITSRHLRIRETKRAGLELLPWTPSRQSGGVGGSNHREEAPTAAKLARITGQKDLKCIIYQMGTMFYRRKTRTW